MSLTVARQLARLVPAAAMALLLGGCALGRAIEADREAATSVVRGKAFAERVCAACHAVAGKAASPRPAAAPFKDIAARFTEGGLASEFDAIGEVGHYDMPKLAIAPGDRRDLTAYLASLAPRRR